MNYFKPEECFDYGPAFRTYNLAAGHVIQVNLPGWTDNKYVIRTFLTREWLTTFPYVNYAFRVKRVK